ncbi:MAG: VPLPA-CTERM sorting domain-containing protein [Pseudomonadota bacterium]
MHIVKLAAVGAVLAGLSISAQADTIRWTLNAGAFDDGSVAAGSFDWDSDTNTVTAFAFSISDGSNPSFVTETFDSSVGDTVRAGAFPLLFTDIDRVPPFGAPRSLLFTIGLIVSDTLDTPVATLPLSAPPSFGTSVLGLCFDCSPVLFGPSSGFLSGINLSATPVPLPAPAWLLVSGLAGLALLRRKAKG